MIRLMICLGLAGILTGCTSADLNGTTFPIVPEKPAKVEKAKADEKQSAPVNANQVTDRNARQALRDLDAELEKDSK